MPDPTCFFCQRLAQLGNLPDDEGEVSRLRHSVVLLGQWQFYQGYCVVVARTHATELAHLPDDERHGFLDEMCSVARAIEAAFQPVKLNYELLGNVVPHLHWHIFPRSADDPERLKPVWLAIDRADRDPAERRRLETGSRPRSEIAALLRRHLSDQHA